MIRRPPRKCHEIRLSIKRLLVLSYAAQLEYSRRWDSSAWEMMQMHGRKHIPAGMLVIAGLCCLPALFLSGCGWWNGQGDEVEEDPILTADDPTADDQPAAQAPKQKLELNLKPGDRFPLKKTVEHTLRQPAADGWSISRSNLEMLLSVTVNEIHEPDLAKQPADPRAGQKKLQVQYHRVQFSQELPGWKKIDYDSDAPVLPIPLVAQGYHGLKDNGFEFWLSANNQILEIVGFDQFLDRCLRDVTPARKQQVRTAMAATAGGDGITNFVEDSIGLLPTTAVREGDGWTRERQVLQPVPMYTSTRYTLRRITDEIAEIDIIGSISPSATFGQPNQTNTELNVTIRSGSSLGNCLLDRRTGLPMQSRVEQSLEMAVRLADGKEFDQHKTTVTTIRYFPEQEQPRESPAAPAGRKGEVVQAVAETPEAPAKPAMKR